MNCRRSLLLLAVLSLAVFGVALITKVGPTRAGDGFCIDSVVVTDAHGNETDEFHVYDPVMIHMNYTVDEGIVPCGVRRIVKAFDQRHASRLPLDSADSDTFTHALNPGSCGEEKIKCILKVFKDGVLLGREKVVKEVTIIGLHGPECYGLEESDCRDCHGDNLADRHHLTPTVLAGHSCTACHSICTPGTPNCENGVTCVRDCLTSGCHTPID